MQYDTAGEAMTKTVARTVHVTATAGPDGAVHLNVPLGEDVAGQEVDVVLRTDSPARMADERPPHPANDADYLAVLDRLHGCIEDPTFEYPMPGMYEPPPRW